MPVKRLGEYCFFSALQCRFYPVVHFHAGVIAIEHQHNCNGIGQEAFAAIGADVKESSCLGSDAFVLKPEGTVIKHKFSDKRLKRLPASWRQGEPGLPTLCTCSQVVQGLLEVFAVKPADQFNNITTVAAGKAIPQVLVETDDKGVGIVTTVQGTRAVTLHAPQPPML
jgi:hypothetical protein